jgi:hypothetical protein
MIGPYRIGDAGCECLTSTPGHYGLWLATFRVLSDGSVITVYCGTENQDPGFVVGKRYRLEVQPILLDE